MYSKRFPELEHQVFHPLDYARVVRKLGNNLAIINELHDILPAANIITISMTASSTSGVNLSDEELETLYASCDFVLDLDESRQKVHRLGLRLRMLSCSHFADWLDSYLCRKPHESLCPKSDGDCGF